MRHQNTGDRFAVKRELPDFPTLVSSAVRNDLDVWAYLKDVLDQLFAGSTDYESLRPDLWRYPDDALLCASAFASDA